MSQLAAHQVRATAERKSVWYLCEKSHEFTPRFLEGRFQNGVTGAFWDPALSLEAWQDGEFANSVRRLHHRGGINQSTSASTILEFAAEERFRLIAQKLLSQHSDFGDGFACWPLPPDIANDTDATVEKVRRLYSIAGGANLMFGLHATAAALEAIETLISDGFNLNLTGVYDLSTYERIAHAYVRGLEHSRQSHDLEGVTAIASFVPSSLDTVVDLQLMEIDRIRMSTLVQLAGISLAKLFDETSKQIFAGPTWEKLARKGARPLKLRVDLGGLDDPQVYASAVPHAVVGISACNVPSGNMLSAHRVDECTPDTVFRLLADGGVSYSASAMVAEEVELRQQAYQALLGLISSQIPKGE